MAPAVPKIGFDRFIDLRWIVAAMNVRTGAGSIEDLIAFLDAARLSVAAKKKVRTILNRLGWSLDRSCRSSRIGPLPSERQDPISTCPHLLGAWR